MTSSWPSYFFIHLNIPVGSDMLYSCIPFILYRENDVSNENLSSIILYLKRNNCIDNTIFIVCLSLLG